MAQINKVGGVIKCDTLVTQKIKLRGELESTGTISCDVLSCNRFANQSYSDAILAGVNPAGMAITPDGGYLYVTNNNNYLVTLADTVSVFDTYDFRPVATIQLPQGNQPYTATMSPDGTLVYIANANFSTVSVIDTATNTISDTIIGFDGPSGMAVTPDGLYGYVNNYGGPGGLGSGNGTTVNRVDLLTNTITGPAITTDLAPAAVAMAPDGTYVYVICYTDGNTGNGTLQRISTTTNLVTDTLGGFSGPFSIVVSADGLMGYVSNFGSNNFDPIGNTVTVVDLDNFVVVRTYTVGIQPSGLALSPDGLKLYVSNYNTLYQSGGSAPPPYTYTGLTAGQGSVQVIDLASGTVSPQVIQVGLSPANLIMSLDGKKLFCSNYTSNTVSVVTL